MFGQPSSPTTADGRTAIEQLYLASALGLMQGWAWADFVASDIKALTTHFGVARSSFEQVTTSFLMTLAFTVVLVAVRACPWERNARDAKKAGLL